MQTDKDGTDRAFLRRALILLGLGAAALAAYSLIDVLLLVFGAVLVAVIFRAIADPIERRTGLPAALGLTIAVLSVLGLAGVTAWLFGVQIRAQMSTLAAQLPQAWNAFEQRLGDSMIGERILSALRETQPTGTSVASRIGGFLYSATSALLDLILVIIAGIFIAASPGTYRRGLLKLVPKHREQQAGETLDATANALRQWLLGQLVSMSVVGVLTGLGLWLVGVPSAISLGIIAGLAEFVPVAGPFIAAVPGLLLALSAGPQTALLALGVYLLVQQVESNLLMPMVQKMVVSIPPAVTLFALLGLGVLFGPVGILLAAPLTVAMFVAVNKLYVRDALGRDTDVPGLDEARGGRAERDAGA